MGVFKQAVITNEGERLLTKIMANATTLKFTHATTSNHEYPEDLNIKELKELEGIRQTTDAPSAQIESENVVGVKALFENAKVEESYYIWNIGLYAESEDGEILFAVCQAQTPDQMPAFKGVAPSAYIYDIRLAISQASSLTIVVNPSGTVTMQDLIELEKKKVSIQGGDISDTVINIENPPDEDKNPVKYPEIGDSGTTKSIMGQIRRWLKSLKDDKVDKKGGDTADTVVSGLTDSTASFPQPTAGDSQKTLWGKVKKWQQDCITKFGNYVLTSMITNQHLNSTSNIPTSALVYLMQQAIQQNQNAINVLNTKQTETSNALGGKLSKADAVQYLNWDSGFKMPVITVNGQNILIPVTADTTQQFITSIKMMYHQSKWILRIGYWYNGAEHHANINADYTD